MRLITAIAVGGLGAVLVAACSSFGSETPSSSDAGAGDGGAMTDASLVGDGSVEASSSSCRGFDIETFESSTDLPKGWTSTGAANGSIGITDAPYANGAKKNYLHATLSGTSEVRDGPTILSPEIPIGKTMRVEFDLAVKSEGRYGEIGCELQLWGENKDKNRVALYLAMASPTSLSAGWDYLSGGVSDSTDDMDVGEWTLNEWKHVSIDATITGSSVSAQVKVGTGQPEPVPTLPTIPYTFASARLLCGIPYLLPEGQQTMDVGIDNVVVSSCP